MIKPKSPKKPKKSDSEPEKIKRVCGYFYKRNDEFLFLNDDNIESFVRQQPNYDEDLCAMSNLYEIGYEVCQYLDQDMIKVIWDKFGGTKFRISIYDTDGDFAIIYEERRSEEEYERDYKQWLNRFDTYESQYVLYQAEMAVYEQERKQKRKEQLLKELSEI
jgi:hypothetical protein